MCYDPLRFILSCLVCQFTILIPGRGFQSRGGALYLCFHRCNVDGDDGCDDGDDDDCDDDCDDGCDDCDYCDAGDDDGDDDGDLVLWPPS